MVGEVLALYYIYQTTVTDDIDNAMATLELHTETVNSNINSIMISIRHNIGQLVSLIHLKGKYVSPIDFTRFITLEPVLENLPLVGYRWIPQVTLSERPEYEAIYKQYYGANFSILNIFFDGQGFHINPAPDNPVYYPFTIAVPQYTLSPMGGNFLYGAVRNIFNISLQQDTILTSARVSLINYRFGVYLSQVVRDANNSISGVVQILMVPHELIVLASSLTAYKRTYYDLFIFDLNATEKESLIYKQNGTQYNNIQVLSDLQLNIYGTTTRNFRCFDRKYATVFIYHKDITDSQLTVLPWIVLGTCLVFWQ